MDGRSGIYRLICMESGLGQLEAQGYFCKQRRLQLLRTAVLLAVPATVFYFLAKWPAAGWRPLLVVAGPVVFRYSLFGSLLFVHIFWQISVHAPSAGVRTWTGTAAVLALLHALFSLTDMQGTLATAVFWELPVPLTLVLAAGWFRRRTGSRFVCWWTRAGWGLMVLWLLYLFLQLLHGAGYLLVPGARSFLVLPLSAAGTAARIVHALFGIWVLVLLVAVLRQRERIYPEISAIDNTLFSG